MKKMSFETYDVILQTTGSLQTSLDDFQNNLPVEGNLVLSNDTWIGALPGSIEPDTVMDACEPTGYNFHPVRQFGCRYAFVRKLNCEDYPSPRWDEDGYLRKVLFLSRLVHPTTIGRYCARLIFAEGKLEKIISGTALGYGTQVWILANQNQWRDWLTLSDAYKLRDVLPRYFEISPPKRVMHARSRIDHAFHSYYLDQRVTALVTGFESLLKVEDHKIAAQLRLRIPQLGARFGITIVDKDIGMIYNERSKIAHGEAPNWTGVDGDLVSRYQNLERLLRDSLLQASIDQEFAQSFSSKQSVRATFGALHETLWPIVPQLSE